MIDIAGLDSFEWDSGNREKNWILHNVTGAEAEEVFFNEPVLTFPDPRHSHAEERFYLLGRTKADRRLHVVFTIRKNRIRIISARDMSRKERNTYDEAVEKDT